MWRKCLQSNLFSLGISHHCLVLKWVPHHFGCKFKSLFTNGKWLKHKNKNTAFLKRKVVVRFSMWQKLPSEADPPYCCWLPPPPPTPLPAAPDTPYITTECDQVPSCWYWSANPLPLVLVLFSKYFEKRWELCSLIKAQSVSYEKKGDLLILF